MVAVPLKNVFVRVNPASFDVLCRSVEGSLPVRAVLEQQLVTESLLSLLLAE